MLRKSYLWTAGLVMRDRSRFSEREEPRVAGAIAPVIHGKHMRTCARMCMWKPFDELLASECDCANGEMRAVLEARSDFLPHARSARANATGHELIPCDAPDSSRERTAISFTIPYLHISNLFLFNMY